MHDDRTSPPRARLHIDGVRTPVLARVARRRETGMTCVQELPFLRLESAVTDDRGRRARIARVALSVEKDMPKLVIELAYDDHDDDFPSGPPGVPSGAITVPVSRDADDTRPDLATPASRGAPVSLRELARGWWIELRTKLASLESALAELLVPRPRFA